MIQTDDRYLDIIFQARRNEIDIGRAETGCERRE